MSTIKFIFLYSWTAPEYIYLSIYLSTIIRTSLSLEDMRQRMSNISKSSINDAQQSTPQTPS